MDLLPPNSVAIFAAAPVKMMTEVVPYTFRQDADYLYITGCQQPGGIAVLSHGRGLCMFMPEASAHVCSNLCGWSLLKFLFFLNALKLWQNMIIIDT